MNTKQQAFQDLKRFSRMFKSFVELADDLDEVSSIEDARDRAEARLGQARAEEANLAVALAQAKVELQAAQNQVRAATEEAANLQANAHAAAEAKAADIRSAASDAAATHMEATKQAAARIIADGQSQAAAALRTAHEAAEQVKTKTQSARDYLAGLESSIADKAAQLQALTDKIALVKQQISSLG